MRAYKAFGSDLKCRGYRFSETGWNEEPEANCAENGFHCAENPLDCLTYYPDMDRSVYYLVEAAGDIDEDSNDSKISCTRIKLVKKLDIKAFVTAALAYIIRHPDRPDGPGVCRDNGYAEDKFVIVRGKNPTAGGKEGTYAGLAVEAPDSAGIIRAAVCRITRAGEKVALRGGRIIRTSPSRKANAAAAAFPAGMTGTEV